MTEYVKSLDSDEQLQSEGYKPALWETGFLRVLGMRGNVSEACEAVEIERSTAYDRRNNYPEFARLWDDTLQQAGDALEEEAWRRAVDGLDVPIFYKGAQIGTIKEYSDALLMLLLRSYRPDKYRERRDITSNGQPISPVIIVKMDIDTL